MSKIFFIIVLFLSICYDLHSMTNCGPRYCCPMSCRPNCGRRNSKNPNTSRTSCCDLPKNSNQRSMNYDRHSTMNYCGPRYCSCRRSKNLRRTKDENCYWKRGG